MLTDFTDAERAIYELDRNDGRGRAKADPYVLHRELARALGGKPLGGEAGLIDALQRGDETVARDAADVLFPAVQAAFGVRPLQPDGTGLNEAEQFKLLLDFLAYNDSLKKKLAG